MRPRRPHIPASRRALGVRPRAGQWRRSLGLARNWRSRACRAPRARAAGFASVQFPGLRRRARKFGHSRPRLPAAFPYFVAYRRESGKRLRHMLRVTDSRRWAGSRRSQRRAPEHRNRGRRLADNAPRLAFRYVAQPAGRGSEPGRTRMQRWSTSAAHGRRLSSAAALAAVLAVAACASGPARPERPGRPGRPELASSSPAGILLGADISALDAPLRRPGFHFPPYQESGRPGD